MLIKTGLRLLLIISCLTCGICFAQANFKLTGIIGSGDSRMALIDGEKYEEGDKIEGYRISKIEERYIIVKLKGKTYRVKPGEYVINESPGVKRQESARTRLDDMIFQAKAADDAEKEKTGADTQSRFKVITGSREISLKEILVPGKITIVDFYADWCGPCQTISPELEKLAQNDPETALCKIDIIKWGLPVTSQYKINAIPYIMVFDKKGKPAGEPTHGLPDILQYVKAAKKDSKLLISP